MLRSIRMAAVQLGVKKTGEEDAVSKQKIADLLVATASLKKIFAQHSAAVQAAQTNFTLVIDAAAATNGASDELAGAISALQSRSNHLQSLGALAEVRGEVEAALAEVDNKLRGLKVMTDDRAKLREEVEHYHEKIAKLQAKNDPAGAQKLEENKQKCADVEGRFAASNEAVTPELQALDEFIAKTTSGPFRRYIEDSVAFLQTVNENLTAGLAGNAVASPVPGTEIPV